MKGEAVLSAKETGTRLHDLDALRAFAMLLGIVLHAAIFLLPGAEFWPVHDRWGYSVEPAENPYGYLVGVIHGFRMPLFFLLSGFFSGMLWESRGLQPLLRHRLRRVGLPLLVGMFTVIPATVWLFMGSHFRLTYWPFAWLGGFAHLWFLWHLLLMAAALIVAARAGIEFRHFLWWLLVPLTLVPQHLMHEPVFGADRPEGLMPSPQVFAYYLIFFLFGVFFYRRQIAVRRWWSGGLAPALILFFPAGLILLHAEPPPGGETEGTRAVSTILRVAFTWVMCFGLMGVFRLVAARERFWLRYVSDASYWMYLVHLPLVIGGQMLVVNWPINVHLKVALICTAASAILLCAYQLGVRYTMIGTMLNGPRSHGIVSANG